MGQEDGTPHGGTVTVAIGAAIALGAAVVAVIWLLDIADASFSIVTRAGAGAAICFLGLAYTRHVLWGRDDEDASIERIRAHQKSVRLRMEREQFERDLAATLRASIRSEAYAELATTVAALSEEMVARVSDVSRHLNVVLTRLSLEPMDLRVSLAGVLPAREAEDASYLLPVESDVATPDAPERFASLISGEVFHEIDPVDDDPPEAPAAQGELANVGAPTDPGERK